MKWMLATLIALLPLASQARPISYPEGRMLMGMVDHTGSSLMASYSPTARDAVGIRSDYMSEDEDWLHTITYNRLLKRWNAADSQGNVYLLTGLGAAYHGDDSNPAGTLGIEADWETRRIYFSYENRYIAAGNIETSYSQKFRAGIAPYVGDYDDVHTWLMVQVDHHPALDDNVVVTPFVRLFNEDVLGEFGISNKKDVMFNLTYQF